MNMATAEKTTVVPFSLRNAPSLIEKAWPTAKISAETQKERKANLGQTLTALGSYWKGRKMLVLNRACILASLLPATDCLERDVEIFEKIMGMSDEAFGRRFTDSATAFSKIFPKEANDVAEYSGRYWKWRNDLSINDRNCLISHAFSRLPYSKRLENVKRPEEIDDSILLEGIWDDVNGHLGTNAYSLPELVRQLGIMRFGHIPVVGDCFSGSGQIPFEAARIGCRAFASDLNPIACMLTWGSMEIIGASPEKIKEIRVALRETAIKTISEIEELGFEKDEKGNRAKAYLYCLEVRCPYTGWMVPVAPSWVISRKRNIIARLVPDYVKKCYNIEVVTNVSQEDMDTADHGTLIDNRLSHPALNGDLGPSIKEIRGDKTDAEKNTNSLRLWDKTDVVPRPDDIFQERLYAIHWMDGDDLKKGKTNPRTWFSAPNDYDLNNEVLIAKLAKKDIGKWQEQGLVPDMEIEHGLNTSQPIRERGWTHWNHAFSPRHLLMNVMLRKNFPADFANIMSVVFCRVLNVQSKMSRWSPAVGHELALDVFYNQSLNTFYNYGCRASYSALRDFLDFNMARSAEVHGELNTCSINGKDVQYFADIWITDPPYADAVRYEEITEYFIAWIRKNPPAPLNEWIWDSRRNLAVKGDGWEFKSTMIDVYNNISRHMPENGLQIVHFTHQDTKTWSDVAQIFWGANLQVVQDWYISTENMTELKKGGYVQGTHIIVLKKRSGDKSGYQDEIVHEIRDEVERQIKEMIGLNDQMDTARGENIFNDADLQMAGYAAALRVLTAYTKIDGVDMTTEALRPRKKGEKTLVDDLTEFAVQIANEFLIPKGLGQDLWLEMNGAERFYLKMMDIEEAGKAKLDQFQNFAKAFRVEDYDEVMASKSPNNAKLKTAIKLGKTSMAEGTPFGRGSIVRLALRGIWRVAKEDDVDEVIDELRDLIPDYFHKRDILRQIVAYVAAKRTQSDPTEASAARILGTAIQTERI
ncbi:anti-phage-associated DUF1156 domain-containing protein [Komagataeibacter europaeus]|uniref:anti-phage-associated DUF1156 domain-containing protein n=1 Tax=Komagataeibacter europaeus TaxID=33995 RepID=UPI0005845C33|nr:anti-phage-associated DUF1156 domain-containing protein [Komagataeibacter europaeus]